MRDFHVGLRICLEKSFPFKMLSTVLLSQRSYPAMLLAEQPVHQRLNISGPLVQGNGFLNSSRTPGRIQTVSRRSKLNSGTIFIGEQPNPWDLFQPQDMISQHRGAKQFRR